MCDVMTYTLKMQDFQKKKEQTLNKRDLSLKGSVDEYIVDLVQYINNQEQYVTTSSCSGRVVLVSRDIETNGKLPKKACRWLFTSHNIFDPIELVQAVAPSGDEVHLKFEPFILHVLCCDLLSANTLIKAACSSGFRESGITVGKNGRTMVAIRSNTQLAVPICKGSILLTSEKYLEFLAEEALQKLKSNFERIDRFFMALKELDGRVSTTVVGVCDEMEGDQ